MTRDQVSRVLMEMERIRQDSYEAESVKEERRLDREYGALSRSIHPYLTGKLPYADEQPAALKDQAQ